MRNNMVRVISVHNFVKQDITSIDEITDVATIPPNILLLVQPNNTILVKDLSLPNDSGYTIPTIDQVIKVVYSIQGNYVAALESKVTRNGTKVSYVRVYINWESLKGSKNTFPMRARIAGRVTPLSQNQQGLEMIEIPTLHMPDNVSCCPISGNLLLSSRNVLTIYNFVIQTHDISKIHFIDFKQLSVDLHLSFIPTRHQLLENVIATQNDEYLHIFQVKSLVPMCSLCDEEFSIDDFEKVEASNVKSKLRSPICYEKLVKELKELNISSNSDNVGGSLENKETNEKELSKINPLSFPVRHEFPTVLLEKSLVDSKYPDVIRQNPFTICSDLTVNLVSNAPLANSSKMQYKITNMCQYHLIPLTIGSLTNQEIKEKFISLILKPYYSYEENKKILKHNLLESDNFGNLKCIACFFGTQQEGYLHCFENNFVRENDFTVCGNYTTYAFTAPVIDIQLGDCFLHAITEAGLETYTMRAAKHLLKSTESSECPSSKDPVCLIGFHSFLKVLKMSITSDYLMLFANNEESIWTLYQLQLPNTNSVWKDFLVAAEENKWDAPSIYCELVGEGHLILKTRLKSISWISQKDLTRNQLSFAYSATLEDLDKIKLLYLESCALLADYHLLKKHYKISYSYYSMSGYKIADIIKRIRSLWQTVPESYRKDYNEDDITEGLIFFLKKTLSFFDQKFYEFYGNREEFYNPEIGVLVTNLMDILEKEEKNSISDLVLESVVLREFSTDRILKILKCLLSKSTKPRDKDALSLALMCIQRDQSDQAKTVLLTMTPSHLEALLLQYYDLLFANNSSSGTNIFTELSMVLIEIYPEVLATVLSNLVTVKRLLSLSKVLHFFIELLPSGGIRSKNSSFVLQIVLENYFKFYSENFKAKKFDYKTTEAVKILIRIYLTYLQKNSEITENEEDTSEILFQEFRLNYLTQLPPFAPEFSQMFLPAGEFSDLKDSNKKQKRVLLKLQGLLSFDGLPEECLNEVRNFLSTQKNVFGSLSLQVLSAAKKQDAISILIASAPQSLSQFAKERLMNKEDWKFLVTQLDKKINEENEDARIKFYLQQILSDILHHVAENINIEDIIDIIPKDFEDTEKYLAIAQSNAQANHLKTLIMITGKQLLASL